MNVESVAQALAVIATPIATYVGLLSRRARRRSEIRENLELIEMLRSNDTLRDHTPAISWLNSKIVLDVAHVSGQQLGSVKKPIPKAGVVAASGFGIGLGYLAFLINREGFEWSSLFPLGGALFMGMTLVGMLIDRDLPPKEGGGIPSTAIPLAVKGGGEEVSLLGSISEASGVQAKRFADDGQVGVVFRFLREISSGNFENGFALGDDTWRLCRVQAWLWNNRQYFGPQTEDLEALADSLLNENSPAEIWAEFIESEAYLFSTVWPEMDVDRLGAGSQPRRVGRDYEVVIIVPIGETGGYFVADATVVPDALVFLVKNTADGWRVAGQGGAAPLPGWPPTWWTVDDPAVEALSLEQELPDEDDS